MPQVIPYVVYALAESSPYLTAVEVAALTVASSAAVLAYQAQPESRIAAQAVREKAAWPRGVPPAGG